VASARSSVGGASIARRRSSVVVPFRESILTRLLQPALEGRGGPGSKVVLLMTAYPGGSTFDEQRSAFKQATSARGARVDLRTSIGSRVAAALCKGRKRSAREREEREREAEAEAEAEAGEEVVDATDENHASASASKARTPRTARGKADKKGGKGSRAGASTGRLTKSRRRAGQAEERSPGANDGDADEWDSESDTDGLASAVPGAAKFLARRRGYAPGKTPAALKRAPGDRSTGKGTSKSVGRRLKSCMKARTGTGTTGKGSVRRIGAAGRRMTADEAARQLAYDETETEASGAPTSGAKWGTLSDEFTGYFKGLPDFYTTGPALCAGPI